MADKHEHRTEADALVEILARTQKTPFFRETPDGRLLALLPQDGGGWEVEDVSDPQREIKAPPFIAQALTLQTLDSLVEYACRFCTEATILLADIGNNSIRAVIDYHAPGKADRAAHSATMALPFSVEWKTWTEIDGKLLDQLEFARFLEENAADIVAPSGAELLEVCRDLQAVRKVDFRKAVRTNSDNESFEYTDETTASTKKGDVEVPTKFALAIPVYFGEGAVSIQAFLRWRLEEGSGLKLGIKLHRPEHVRQAVFKQIVLGAAERIERPAVFGRLDRALYSAS